MRFRPGRVSKAFAFIFLTLFLASTMISVLPPVSAAPYLSLKWRRTDLVETHLAALATDIEDDGDIEIIAVGGDPAVSGNGAVFCLDGDTGATIWKYSYPYIGTHSPFEVVDLDLDGIKEVLVCASYVFALRGDDGSLYWENLDALGYQNYPAVMDIDAATRDLRRLLSG